MHTTTVILTNMKVRPHYDNDSNKSERSFTQYDRNSNSTDCLRQDQTKEVSDRGRGCQERVSPWG